MRDIPLLEALLRRLNFQDREIIWYGKTSPFVPWQQRVFRYFDKLPRWIRGLAKPLIVSLVEFIRFGNRDDFLAKEQTISGRAENLLLYLRQLGPDADIVILSRSAGGRVSSLVADKANISCLVCLGYPFKHPDMSDEPERYMHLRTLKTPMLILQGTQDIYGGIAAIDTYVLSPSIDRRFIETGHEFDLGSRELDEAAMLMKEFIASHEPVVSSSP